MSKISPLSNNVLVSLDENDEKTPGGLYVPPNAEQKFLKGSVVAIGPGKLNDSGGRLPMEVSVSQQVILSKHNNGILLEEDGKKYILVEESEIVAVIYSR